MAGARVADTEVAGGVSAEWAGSLPGCGGAYRRLTDRQVGAAWAVNTEHQLAASSDCCRICQIATLKPHRQGN